MPKNVKRLRVIAGPNGSGKSTFIKVLQEQFDCGVYINTDDIERSLKAAGLLTLSDYQIDPDDHDLQTFFQLPNVVSLIEKAHLEKVKVEIRIEHGQIFSSNETNSYEAALVGEFIKQQLLREGKKFTFETVMSHASKLDLIDQAIAHGYKVYLYFITTESVEINVLRVAQRVGKNGHAVAEDRIRSRYAKTMKLLSFAIKRSYRAFLFDNSSYEDPLRSVAEIHHGEKIKITTDELPNWVIDHVLSPMGVW
jgi:predicted ABC-type ATPase